jgi:putative nucleotidyltransferase with HDIG domain
MGINDELQTKAIEAAALLHDMGKLAVPDYILNKPGPLTPAEFGKMKRHAAIGAEILASIDFPYPVVPIVRHHHENWDGTGYPDGLKGTEIPIGARILSVVDCFDALTSDRPYRLRLSDQEALRILRERRATMYDPLIVDAFTNRYEGLARELERIERHDDRPGLLAIAESAFRSRPTPLRGSEGLPEAALEQLDLTHLLSESAPELFEATVVVFRRDNDSDVLRVVSACGPAAPKFFSTKRALTDRVVGWVAANATSIHNADARLDAAGSDQTGTCSAVPILSRDVAVGVVAAYTAHGRILSPVAVAQLETLAKNSKIQTTTLQLSK